MSLLRPRTHFDAGRFEYVMADSHTALLRVEGSWGDHPPAPDVPVILVARDESGASELRPLPDAARAEPGHPWRAAYPASPALLVPGVRFSLRAGDSKPVDLGAPQRRGLAGETEEAESERAARHLAEAELRDARRDLVRARTRADVLSAGVRAAAATGESRLDAMEAKLIAVRDSLEAAGEGDACPAPPYDQRVSELAARGAERAAAIEDSLREIRAALERTS